MRKLFLITLLLLAAFAAQAQDAEATEEPDAIPYLQLGTNFAVPDLPAWEHAVSGETATFTNAALDAQIYVSVYDTQDIDSAILQAIEHVYTGETPETIFNSRIGRSDSGTWEYRLFSAGDSSISAYGLIKSGRVIVVLFIENSADYTAYHVAVRGTSSEIAPALSAASLFGIQSTLNPEFAGEVQATSNPNPDNTAWILAEYPDNIATASYLNDEIVYVTVLEGDASIAPELSNAFDTVFLGFVITPDNSEYLYLGLTFASVIMLTLLVSMWLRYRNLHQDLKMIEQLGKED